MKRLIDNLRVRLLLLVLMATVPALLITYQSGTVQRQLAREQAVSEAYRFTRLAADYQISIVNQARTLLQFLSKNPTGLHEAESCNQTLADFHQIFPQYNSIVAANLDGRIYCSSPINTATVEIADRDYFQAALREKTFFIGRTTTGRLTNKLIQPFAMPLMAADGQSVSGVLLVTINMDTLLAYTAKMELPPQSAILVIDSSGRVITRYPETEKYVGRDLQDVPIIRQILDIGGEGSTEAVGLDGVTRLYAFTPLQSAEAEELFISIGIPSSIAYSKANQLQRQTFLLLGVATLAAMGLAWFGGDVMFLRVVSLTAERDKAEQELRVANQVLEQRVTQRTEELAQANIRLKTELAERSRLVRRLQKQELDLREALSDLERSNRDLQDFAYIASHDMQEPLRKIQAFSERLDHRFADALGKDGQDFLNRIQTSASRMQAMINALLAYSRVNSKGHALVPTKLNEAVDIALNDLEIRIQETGAEVLVEPLPTIDGDLSQLAQLFLNLVGNAIKFRQPDVPLRVKIGWEDRPSQQQATRDMIAITVTDNGMGFDEKYLDRIFKPFQRLHSRSEFEGSGIGLAICRKIVERMNGTITATSTPGQGSCFLITLPKEQTERPQEEGILEPQE